MTTYTQQRLWFGETASHIWGVWTLRTGKFFGAVREKASGCDLFGTPPRETAAEAQAEVERWLADNLPSGTDAIIAQFCEASPEFRQGYESEKARIGNRAL